MLFGGRSDGHSPWSRYNAGSGEKDDGSVIEVDTAQIGRMSVGAIAVSEEYAIAFTDGNTGITQQMPAEAFPGIAANLHLHIPILLLYACSHIMNAIMSHNVLLYLIEVSSLLFLAAAKRVLKTGAYLGVLTLFRHRETQDVSNLRWVAIAATLISR